MSGAAAIERRGICLDGPFQGMLLCEPGPDVMVKCGALKRTRSNGWLIASEADESRVMGVYTFELRRSGWWVWVPLSREGAP